MTQPGIIREMGDYCTFNEFNDEQKVQYEQQLKQQKDTEDDDEE